MMLGWKCCGPEKVVGAQVNRDLCVGRHSGGDTLADDTLSVGLGNCTLARSDTCAAMVFALMSRRCTRNNRTRPCAPIAMWNCEACEFWSAGERAMAESACEKHNNQ